MFGAEVLWAGLVTLQAPGVGLVSKAVAAGCVCFCAMYVWGPDHFILGPFLAVCRVLRPFAGVNVLGV